MIVEKPVTVVEKVVETVVVEKQVEWPDRKSRGDGDRGKAGHSVVEKVIETVVVEKVVDCRRQTSKSRGDGDCRGCTRHVANIHARATADGNASGNGGARTRATADGHADATAGGTTPAITTGGAYSPPPQPEATTFEDYERQPLTDASEDAVSTFSLDTDRTSFQLALNWARSGYQVDPASVRAEEWVNAFDYGYAAPSVDDRFAITSDLFEHPLDNGRYMARVAFKAPEVVTDAPLNVTLVLDASGSMSSGNRVAIAREAAEAIRRSLDRDDRISVVHFTTYVLDEPHGRERRARRPRRLRLHR